MNCFHYINLVFEKPWNRRTNPHHRWYYLCYTAIQTDLLSSICKYNRHLINYGTKDHSSRWKSFCRMHFSLVRSYLKGRWFEVRYKSHYFYLQYTLWSSARNHVRISSVHTIYCRSANTHWYCHCYLCRWHCSSGGTRRSHHSVSQTASAY